MDRTLAFRGFLNTLKETQLSHRQLESHGTHAMTDSQWVLAWIKTLPASSYVPWWRIGYVITAEGSPRPPVVAAGARTAPNSLPLASYTSPIHRP